MFSNKSSAKSINNNLSIVFANDNFSFKNYFLLKTKTPNLPKNISSSFPFKTNPSSSPNSSLFLFKQTLEQKQFAPGFASFRLRSFLNPFWLENNHYGLFSFTPEPNITALKSTSSSATKS